MTFIKKKVSSRHDALVGLFSMMNCVFGTNSRKLLIVIISAVFITMFFATIRRNNIFIMQSPRTLLRTFTPTLLNSTLDSCTVRNSSFLDGRQICLRYEVYVIQAEAPNSGSTKDVDLLKRLLTASECRLMSVYHLHVVHYKDSAVRPVNETTNLLSESIQRCRSEGVSVHLDFLEISERRSASSTLDQTMKDSYVQRSIDFVSIIFADDFAGASSPASAADFVRVLARSKPKNVGVVFQNGSSTGSGSGLVFFSRNHFEIFGFYLPQTLTDLNSVPEFLEILYPAQLYKEYLPVTLGQDRTVYHRSTITTSKDDDVIRKISKLQKHSEISQLDLAEYNATLSRYVHASALNPCLRCLNRTSRKVIAMSLYGSDPRYTMGAIRNAQLLPVVFPGWRLWFYVEVPNSSGETKYSRVPDKVLVKLVDLGAEVVWVDVEAVGLAPMLWRFTVMDSDDVDVFTVRDADSRLTPRDAAVVSDWLKTDRLFHCIRDHPSHSNYDVSGGLWGARRKPFQQLIGNLREAMKRYGAGYVEDMNFLGRDVWPKVINHAYCHDSFSCDRFPSSHPFPVARIGYEHLGEVYDQNSIGRQDDINILKNAEVNRKCIPPSS